MHDDVAIGVRTSISEDHFNFDNSPRQLGELAMLWHGHLRYSDMNV